MCISKSCNILSLIKFIGVKTSPYFFCSITFGFKQLLINSNNSIGLSIRHCKDILNCIEILYVFEFLSK